VQTDIELFRDRLKQYIFISTASAYAKPVSSLPITEKTPLSNPFWEYSRLKIACERQLMTAYEQHDFPVTIVRPSHTYDKTKIPLRGGYTAIDRMRSGLPIFIHGDGTSLWVLTHHQDFAKGFVGLLGNDAAIGEDFHITSDELLTWNHIHDLMARAAGCYYEPVFVPSTVIKSYDDDIGDGLLGDKAHSVIFDNSKIRKFVPKCEATIPFSAGAMEIMQWYDADPARHVIDNDFNQLTDRLIRQFSISEMVDDD
jgi:nucleoside-diphosphate-sugar epimerase